MTPGLAWIGPWLDAVRREAQFEVATMDLAASREWSSDRRAIRHRSGRFFNIVGVRWKGMDGTRLGQPFIEQREIGTLGMLMREYGGRRQVLIQAKVEPGNVGVVQLAPTCQATASNVARVHGGEAPPFAGAFQGDGRRIVRETLQSEQGSRFLGKRNLNVLAEAANGTAESRSHRWVAVHELVQLLTVDHLVNTDARSVLTCSPWSALVDDPFTTRRDGFETELRRSWEQPPEDEGTLAVTTAVLALRSVSEEPEVVGLDDLSGWKISGCGVHPAAGAPFAVRHVKVSARGREVPTWDQPIVDSAGEGRVDLVCGRREGILLFQFMPRLEPGLHQRVELGATVTVEPGAHQVEGSPLAGMGIVRAACRQSDEGGRFFQDSCHYRIVDIGEARASPCSGYWLNLGQVSHLLAEGGWFTNEARSALSLLLSWL